MYLLSHLHFYFLINLLFIYFSIYYSFICIFLLLYFLYFSFSLHVSLCIPLHYANEGAVIQSMSWGQLFACSWWLTIICNTVGSRHFFISTSAQLVETSVWGTATFLWPCSLQLIQTAVGCLVFYLPEFLHVTLLLLCLHWLPVVAHFKIQNLVYKTANECTWPSLQAMICPESAYQLLNALHSANVACLALLIMWPGNHSSQPQLSSLLALKNIGMTFPPQPGPKSNPTEAEN